MLASIGPVTGTGNLLQWDFENLRTSGGVLFFDDNATVPMNFTATIVPEPGVIGLAAVAFLVGCCLRANRQCCSELIS